MTKHFAKYEYLSYTKYILYITFIYIINYSKISSYCRDRFHYFKAEDDRWKNSVRHNLSMNPHFRKGGKAKQGSGHLWVLADYDKEDQLPHVSVQHQDQHHQPEQPNISRSNVNQHQNSILNVSERVTGSNNSNPQIQYSQKQASLKVNLNEETLEKDIDVAFTQFYISS